MESWPGCPPWSPVQPTWSSPYEPLPGAFPACDAAGVVARLSLVLTNLVFALPLWECVRQALAVAKERGLAKGAQVSWFLTPDIALFALIILASGMYHACDSGSDACKVCIASWTLLNHLDFALSMTIAALPIFWSSDIDLWRWKCSGLLIALVGNIAYVQVAFPGGAVSLTWPYALTCGCLYLAMYAVRLYYYYEQTREEWSQLRWSYFIAAVLLSTVGFLCQQLTHSEEYWYLHSVWHVAQGLALFCRIRAAPIQCPVTISAPTAATMLSSAGITTPTANDVTHEPEVDESTWAQHQYAKASPCRRLGMLLLGQGYRMMLLVGVGVLLVILGVGLFGTTVTLRTTTCPVGCAAVACMDERLTQFRCRCCYGSYSLARYCAPIPFMEAPQYAAISIGFAGIAILASILTLTCGCCNGWTRGLSVNSFFTHATIKTIIPTLPVTIHIVSR